MALAAQMARVVGALAVEKVRPPAAPTTLADVPASVDHLTTGWLTAALCDGVPGAHVTSFALGEGSDGTSSRRALRVAYDAAGTAAGLPTDLYTKSTPSLSARLLLGISGAADAEAAFYRDLRPLLPQVGAPHGYAGRYDPRTGRSMIVMEDIAATRGATFGNAAIHVDRSAAESMVREMAAYHGAMWDDPRLRTVWPGLKDAHTWQVDFDRAIQWGRGAAYGMRRAQDVIPDALMAHRRDIWALTMRSLRLAVDGPHTLLHQDTHPANWFRLPDGTLHLYDWQGIARGSWAIDVAYALGAALEVEDRRAWERDLLALYLEELAAAGGARLGFDEAWLAWRRQMFHGFVFWTYTIGVQRISPELQPDAHCRLIIGRIAQAMIDLDSVGSLR